MLLFGRGHWDGERRRELRKVSGQRAELVDGLLGAEAGRPSSKVSMLPGWTVAPALEAQRWGVCRGGSRFLFWMC